MKIFDPQTMQEMQSPDLSKGYTFPGRIKVGTEDVLLPGSVETFPPNGLRKRRDLYEECLFYHEYTEEELAAKNQPSQLDRVEAQATYTAMMTDTLLEV